MPLINKEKRAAQAQAGTKKAATGLNTGLARTTQKVLAAVGRVDESVDVEFTWAADNSAGDRKLLDELDAAARVFLKAIQSFAINQRKLADSMLELYEASADTYNSLLTNQGAAIALEKHAVELEQQLTEQFMEPLKVVRDTYEDMKNRIEKVDDRRVDADRYYREYLAALQKPGHDARLVIAAKATFEDARTLYDALNEEVRADLVKLRAQKSQLLEPLLATLVDVQLKIHGKTMELLKDAVNQLPPGVDPNGAWNFVNVVTPEAESACLGGTDYLSFPPYEASGLANQVGDGAVEANDPFSVGLPPTTATPPASATHSAVALYDFDATDASELSFKKGDKLTIHKKEGDWWVAELKGRRGEIPSNRVSLEP